MPTESSVEEEKLVSIICRSIGRPELQQALQSVSSQTYPNLEIILVDAAAKNLHGYEEYSAHVPVKLIFTGAKLPRSLAANTGLEAASGDFIMFLDDDDWIAKDHIQNLMQFLLGQTEIRAAYSSTQKTDRQGTLLDDIFDKDFDPLFLMRDNYIPIHAMLFDSNLLDHGCRFDESFDIYEDWDFWLQLSQHTQFKHIPQVTAFYREGGEFEAAMVSPQLRYDNESLMGKTRISLFDKWLPYWNGAKVNQILGALDQSTLVGELTTQIDKINTSLAKQQKITHETQTENVNLVKKLATSQQVLVIAHERIDKNLLQLSQLQDKLAGVTAHLAGVTAHLAGVTAHLARVTAHKDDLEEAYNMVLRSTSWRLMGPFRRCGHMLKQIFRIPVKDQHEPKGLADEETNLISAVVTVSQEPKYYSIDDAMFCSGYLYIRGWVVSEVGISNVQVVCNGKKTAAFYGQERNDIEQAFPNMTGSDRAGFLSFEKVDSIASLHIEFEDEEGNLEKVPIEYAETSDLSALSNFANFVKLDAPIQYHIYMVQRDFEKKSRHLSVESFAYRPLISIIIPTYNVESKWLDACVHSVLSQIYENWELCLYDDASTNEDTLACLRRWEHSDKRIKIEYGTENLHISGASNKALAMVTGEFVGLMDNDDELTNDALFYVIELLNKHRDADYIYTDEDKISEDGKYFNPHFKPAWSPELLESMMYVGHFSVIRKSILVKVGGFRNGYEGSQDYDLTLRIAEITSAFHHIPRILYHWRVVPGSVAGGGNAKQYAYTSAVNALQDHINASELTGTVETTEYSGLYRIRRESGNPSVTIVIPFHDKAEMTIDCLESIEISSYENYSILLISNNSTQDQYKLVQQFTSTRTNIKLEKYDLPFNWAAINNWAARKCDSEYIIFLNNDTKFIAVDWIEALLDCGIKPNVGVVGAKLLYEDDTIQHAGIIMQIGGIAGLAFRYLPDNVPHYFGYASAVRNCSAVTGACMLVPKKLLLSLGGFEESLRVAYNDVDFCLRVIEENYRIVYTPFAKLYHLESKSRPKTPDEMTASELSEFEKESDYMRNRHRKYFENGDPFYNSNLTLKLENYSLNI